MTSLHQAIYRRALDLGCWGHTGATPKQPKLGLPAPTIVPQQEKYLVFKGTGESLHGSLQTALCLLCVDRAVEGEACFSCVLRGGGWDWKRWTRTHPGAMRTASYRLRRRGWDVSPARWSPQEGLDPYVVHTSRPCRMCSIEGEPTGRVQRPLSGLVLSEHPAARDMLIVEADRLANSGDPLGTLLSLWLQGQLEERHILYAEVVPRAEEISRSPEACPARSEQWLRTGKLNGVDGSNLPRTVTVERVQGTKNALYKIYYNCTLPILAVLPEVGRAVNARGFGLD